MQIPTIIRAEQVTAAGESETSVRADVAAIIERNGWKPDGIRWTVHKTEEPFRKDHARVEATCLWYAQP